MHAEQAQSEIIFPKAFRIDHIVLIHQF
ncbi:hypothetical protein [Blautia sp.]